MSLTKLEYMKELLMGRIYDPRISQAAFVYWHSSIPIEQGKVFMDNFQSKIIMSTSKVELRSGE